RALRDRRRGGRGVGRPRPRARPLPHQEDGQLRRDPGAARMTVVGALLLLIPLAVAAICGFFGAKLKGRSAGILATLGAASCFVLALVALAKLLGTPESERSLSVPLYTWLALGAKAEPLTLNVGLLLDPLSVTWALVITGVGSLIFLYSIAYMEHEA